VIFGSKDTFGIECELDRRPTDEYTIGRVCFVWASERDELGPAREAGLPAGSFEHGARDFVTWFNTVDVEKRPDHQRSS
jgi:hypothetical protein